MEPRDRRREAESPEMDDRVERVIPGEDDPLEPDDDTLGRPVQLQP
jgi:hypothetical protein